MQITKIPVSIYRFYKEGIVSIFVARQSEIPALNGLRAFAILLILFLHLWEGIHKEGLLEVPFILERLFNSCHSAIEIFYALSGYLIYGGLISAKDKNKNKPIDFKKFYINRTLRIFPAYYFFIFITYGMIFLQKLFLERKFTLGEKAHEIQILQETVSLFPYDLFYLSNYIKTAHPHTWSLAVEEQFYLLLPLLCYFLLFKLSDAKRIKVLFLLWTIPLCLRTFTVLVFPNSNLGFSIFNPFHTRFDSLLSGVIIYELIHYHRLVERFGFDKPKRQIFYLLLSSLILFCAHLISREKDIVLSAVLQYDMLYLGYGTIFILALQQKSLVNRFFSTKLFVPFAKVSYGMYLWQYIFGIAAVAAMTQNLKTISPFYFIKIYIAMVASIFMGAILMYLLVEYPFLVWKDKIAARQKATNAQGATP